MSGLERVFQSALIRELKQRFPGCVVLKTDANYIQGFPDLLLLYGRHWAALECKKGAGAAKRPNQEYYVGQLDGMSFARFISPENKEEVLYELERSFQTGGRARTAGGKQV